MESAIVQELRRKVNDLEIALQNSNEHGDFMQEHLCRLSASLREEVWERQAAEHKLKKLVQAATKEKADLEILIQILIDQGDESAEEGGKARIDALTQIANRRRFDEFLSHEWACHLQRQEPLSLLVCDVDCFKLFNDHYGHQAGDECLKGVAGAIASCLRSHDLVARYGGEEFAIVLPRTDLKVAVRVAERVLAAVPGSGIPNTASPICDRITVSAGVACQVPQFQGELDARGLLAEADRFLYLAKRRGRNRVAHHEETQTNDQ